MHPKDMHQELETQLKNDARAIQAQATARLADAAFQQRLQDSLKQAPNHSTRRFRLVAAAAMVLLSGSWVMLNQLAPPKGHSEPALLTQAPTMWHLKPNTAQFEKTINQPLRNEQQAIINDLKALKAQMLSI
jgi:hypothetical protein